MWEVVEQMVVKGFIASKLYVIVEPAIVEAGEGSQHTVLDGTIDEHIEYHYSLIKGVQRTQEMGMAMNHGKHFPK